MNKILLNNEDYKITEQQLPYLVIYGDKSGGSHFTVTLMKDLFLSGSKILFFTAFPMAKDNFLQQIGLHSGTKIAFLNSLIDLENNGDAEVLIIESGNEGLFVEVLQNLEDINDRVVLVKNIEAFNHDVFNACLHLEKVIFSGDIDRCVVKKELLNKNFNSIVVFTKPELALPLEVPELEKWTGYLSSENQSGMIKVQMD